MSYRNKSLGNYHEIDGIVWMKRTNNNHHHLEFTNSKFRHANAATVAANNDKTKMEHDKDRGTLPRKADGANDKHADGEDTEHSSYEESFSDQEIALNDEDVWDDSLLIKMYEASQKQINDELTKRFTAKTSEPPSEEPPNLSSAATTVTAADSVSSSNAPSKKSKHRSHQQKAATQKANVDPKPVFSKPMNWKEGDYCQLTYLEDNVDYEAKIISINSVEQTCLVRYIGYENEEVRSLTDLKPSEGEKVRKLQIEMAIQDGYVNNEIVPSEQQQQQQNPYLLQATAPEFMLFKHLPSMPAGSGAASSTSRIIPPPPPFLHQSVAGANNNQVEDDDDVLASMLMAWYMAGFHTGYHQGRKLRETGS